MDDRVDTSNVCLQCVFVGTALLSSNISWLDCGSGCFRVKPLSVGAKEECRLLGRGRFCQALPKKVAEAAQRFRPLRLRASVSSGRRVSCAMASA